MKFKRHRIVFQKQQLSRGNFIGEAVEISILAYVRRNPWVYSIC